MERIRILTSHLSPPKGIKRVIVFRHAEREDHIRPEWSADSLRPHDPPLSELGRRQAKELGEHIRAAYPMLDVNNVMAFSSPFVRTVMTMDGVMGGMFKTKECPKIKLEQLFSEKGKNIHRRMRGLHHTSFNEGHTRQVCNPILLGPSDLMSITLGIDTKYRSTTVLKFDSTGMESKQDGEISTIQDRLSSGIQPFLSQFAPSDPSTAFVATHGGVSRHLIQALTGKFLSYRPGYCHCHVLEFDDINNCWIIKYSWLPASSSVKDGSKQLIAQWKSPWPEKN